MCQDNENSELVGKFWGKYGGDSWGYWRANRSLYLGLGSKDHSNHQVALCLSLSVCVLLCWFDVCLGFSLCFTV